MIVRISCFNAKTRHLFSAVKLYTIIQCPIIEQPKRLKNQGFTVEVNRIQC